MTRDQIAGIVKRYFQAKETKRAAELDIQRAEHRKAAAEHDIALTEKQLAERVTEDTPTLNFIDSSERKLIRINYAAKGKVEILIEDIATL